MADKSQNQQGGNNSKNYQASRDIYVTEANQDEKDYGIIDEIFKDVLRRLKNLDDDNEQDSNHLHLIEKIPLNFNNAQDQTVVKDYMRYALSKMHLIERRIREENSETQKTLHGHIFGKYRDLKRQGKENMEILEDLFQEFVISGKTDNPDYTIMGKAFVLFFFDDCTIFEKTQAEKQIQQLLL